MKKRMISLLLMIVTTALLLGGCGSSDSEKKQIVTDSKNESEQKQEEEAAAEEKKEISIEEQVILDQDGVCITAREYVSDSIWGDGIKLLVENNSDQNLMIGCDALIVNDYMISDLFVSSVAAGKKANETMYLSSSALSAAGIKNIGKIEMYFHAYDDNSYENLFSEVYSEIKTSEYDNMDTSVMDEGEVLFDDAGIKIVGKSVDEDSFWGTAILLYTENHSGKNVGVTVEDMSINGFMMDPFFSATVYDGKKSIDTITIFSGDLEKNGIETIEQVELKFHIYDTESYSTIMDSEVIQFNAE